MATKKKATKKTTVKRPVKAKKSAELVDFKASKETVPFLTFKITQQTFYWLMLLLLIFALSIWVLDIQLQTNEILDSIQASL